MFKVGWIKESVEDKISNIKYSFSSPREPVVYKADIDKVTKVGSNPSSNNEICLQKSKIITEQYKLKKTIDGQVVIPEEYKENGKIYSGNSQEKTTPVSIDQYSIKLEEVVEEGAEE